MARKNRRENQPKSLARRLFTRSRGTGAAQLTARLAHLERLEARQVMAVISEFQALNESTLQDVDGEYSDWIEIRNPSVTVEDVGGWYLTDDSANLTKWRFPANTKIEPGQQLVVFASDKNRTVAGQELHTNFKLSTDGEYLALVRPDGVTKSTVFNPYPPQVADQSYGLAIGRDIYSLVTDSTAVKALVPTDNSLGTSWTQPGFNDAAWQSGNQGVGYEVLRPGFSVNQSFDAPLGAEWTTDLPAGGTAQANVTGGNLVLNVPTGHDATSLARGTAPIVHRTIPADTNGNYEVITQITQLSADRGTSGIVIVDGATGKPAVTLEYTNRLNFRLLANNKSQGSKTSLNRDSYYLRLVRDSQAQAWTGYYKLLEADEWTLVGTATDGVNEAPFVDDPRLGLYARTPSSTMNATFSFMNIVVPDQKPVYGPEIGLDVGAAMRNNNASLYVRIPFNVDVNPTILDELTLTSRYDDGFRAFLNGTELRAQNVPIESTWNSAASTESGAVNGIIPVQSFSVASKLGSLQQGANVLAIQAMNVAAGDLDFYFDATLIGANVLSETAQFFTLPTPNASNELPAAPIPVITAQQGVFFGSTEVAMSIPGNVPNLQIRYTLDGTDPTASSQLYSGPFTLNQSAMLQARVFDSSPNPLYAAGNAASATLIAVDPALLDFSSNLPVMVLDTIGRSLPSTDSTTLVSMNAALFETSEATGRSSIGSSFVDYLGRGGARNRGSSTGSQAKPNMAFETWGATGTTQDDDEAASLLGLAPDADWVLHAPLDFDRTLFHNQLAYELGSRMGFWTPKYRHVEVYLNRNSDGVVTQSDYAGVYVLLEKIEEGKDRVDIADISPDVTLDPNDTSPEAQARLAAGEPNISGGYIWKVDRADPGEPGFSAGGQGLNWVYPKSPNSNTAEPDQKASKLQEDWVKDYLGKFRTTLNNPDITDPEGYSKYIDPVSWVDNHLMNVLTMNVDALRLSAYLYKDRDDRVKYGPPWDFDRALESSDGRDDNPNVWRSEVPDFGTDFFGNGTQQWWGNLFQDKGFWQLYIDRWQAFRTNVLSDASLSQLIDSFADDLREAQVRDVAKWAQNRPRPSSGYKGNPLDGTYQGEINNMKQWLLERAHFMDNNFAQRARLSINGEILNDQAGAMVAAGSQVNLSPPPLEFFADTKLIAGEKDAASGRYFVPADDTLGTSWTARTFDDAAWAAGPLGYGFDESANPDFNSDLVATVIKPGAIAPGSTTILTRVPFQVTNLAEVQAKNLVLRMKYDDGYVAYLNGTELVAKNLRDTTLAWNSRANTHTDADGKIFEDVDISAFKHLLVAGTNVLAIRGINSSATSNDMYLQPELVSREILFGVSPNSVIYYTTNGTDPRGGDGLPSASAIRLQGGGNVTITQNTRIIARNFDDSDRGIQSQIVRTDWSGPIQYDLSVAPQTLVVSEVNYNPAPTTAAEQLAGYTRSDFEFVEIENPGNQSVNLLGVKLTSGVQFDFYTSAIQTLAPGARAVVVANQAAFQSRYGAGVPIAGTFTGSLDDTGENIELQDATGNSIFSVGYADSDPWAAMADGNGATLVLKSPATVTPAQQSKYYSWRASVENGGTPGAASAAPVGIVINEVLANTANPSQLTDAIELHNPTGAAIDVSGWFLSDSTDNLFAYQIPNGTVIAAGGYRTFNEANFNATNDPERFALSANGDSVYLVRGTKAANANFGGTVSHFVDDVSFRATLNGESLGRFPNGSGRLAPLTQPTLGTTNVNPRLGTVIINEIQYNPLPSAAALAANPTLESSDLEYVEIRNPAVATISLSNWRLRGGADYDFPAGTTLAAGETLVLLKFDPANPENVNQLNAFRAQYGIGPEVRLLGGFSGQLNNSYDDLILLRPDTLTDPVDPPYVQVDEVLYDDLAPWPTGADGTGRSIHRTSPTAFGNAGASWTAADPSPGSLEIPLGGDLNGDGVANAADINDLFVQMRSASPDLAYDLTGDGLVDAADRDYLIEDVFGTSIGDANLDGVFNSSDFVAVFQVGEYEDAIPGNSTWEEGDWNGDGDFTTQDFVLALQKGGFVFGATNVDDLASVAAAVDQDAKLASPVEAAPNGRLLISATDASAARPRLDLVGSSVDSLFADDVELGGDDSREELSDSLWDDGLDLWV